MLPAIHVTSSRRLDNLLVVLSGGRDKKRRPLKKGNNKNQISNLGHKESTMNTNRKALKSNSLIVLLVVATILATAFSSVMPVQSAYAQGNKPVVVGPFYDDSAPIPVGALVTVTVDDDNRYVLNWNERLQNGYVPHAYVYENVGIQLMINGHTQAPQVGDEGFVALYMTGENHIVMNVIINKAIHAPAGRADLQVLPSVFERQLPLPIGSVVTFHTMTGFTQIAFEWDEQRHNAVTGIDWFYNHAYVLKNVDMIVDAFKVGPMHKPTDGNVAVFTGYATDDHGRITHMLFTEYGTWDAHDVALLSMVQAFYDESKQKNFALLNYVSDCPSDILVNGAPMKKGPYGDTIALPKNGAWVSSWFKRESLCSAGNPMAWRVFAKPGDVIEAGTGNASVRISVKDYDIGSFCALLNKQRPQWQPKEIPQGISASECGLYTGSDKGTNATLARLGFAQVQSANMPIGVVPLTYKGATNNFPMPDHKWVTTDYVLLASGDVYTVSLGLSPQFHTYEAHFTLISGNNTAEGDIPWYTWGSPLLFAPEEQTADLPFDWGKYEIFRVVRTGWDTMKVQQLVWK